jgi:hypothetical protein
MSEEKLTFMHELDLWIEANIIGPLGSAASAFEGEQEDWEPTVEQVKKAIREKVLESYKNGLFSCSHLDGFASGTYDALTINFILP